MAEKPSKKPSSSGNDSWKVMINFLLILALIYAVFTYFFPTLLTDQSTFDKLNYYSSLAPSFLVSFLAKIMIFGIFVAIAFAILSVIWWIKYQAELEETLKYLKTPTSEETSETKEGILALKWQEVLKYASSESENDWIRAIISSDVILGDLLDGMSLPGDTIGEKLKAVEKGNFQTLDNAWEAHKIRNAIAHSGMDFQINQREVRRIIDLYESVFKEFKII